MQVIFKVQNKTFSASPFLERHLYDQHVEKHSVNGMPILLTLHKHIDEAIACSGKYVMYIKDNLVAKPVRWLAQIQYKARKISMAILSADGEKITEFKFL